MKLVIAGASGFVGRELVRQSLRRGDITTVVTLTRQGPAALNLPDDGAGAASSKLKTIVLEDYGEYPDEAKKALGGANACIWTVAITPTKSKDYSPEEVRRVCHTVTLTGLEALHAARPANPFRFLYVSGVRAERDRTKTPVAMPEYCWMRGDTENAVLEYAARHRGQIEACVAKPGFITGEGGAQTVAEIEARLKTRFFPHIPVQDLAAAMLDQVLNGFDKEPLMNEDLVSIAQRLGTGAATA